MEIKGLFNDDRIEKGKETAYLAVMMVVHEIHFAKVVSHHTVNFYLQNKRNLIQNKRNIALYSTATLWCLNLSVS